MTSEAKDLMRILTPAEVMEWLRIRRTKLYDLIEQGLPFHSLSPGGRTKVFYADEVQAWLDGRGTSRARPAEAPARPRRGRPTKAEAARPRKWIKV